MPRVAIVHAIVRDGGASTRQRWWRDVLGMLDMDVDEVPLLPVDRRIMPRGLARLGPVVAGSTAPETLVWSDRSLRSRLDRVRPDAVVVLTLRAFRPSALPAGIPVVLDYVDRLSESYRQRASIEQRPLHRTAWRLLATTMRRAEDSAARTVAATVAAGREDAMRLDASWLPITIPLDETGREPLPSPPAEPRWDALFTGTLDYGPNVAAVRALADQVWPEVLRARPQATLCIAGRRATPEVRRLARAMGAELRTDFDDFAELAAQATLAIAPLPLATGMQIKVLTAAAVGVPQVISPAAAAGIAPGFPARVAAIGAPFAHQIVDLLEDTEAAAELGRRSWEEVRSRYTTEQWAGAVGSLFAPDDHRPAGDGVRG